MHEVVEFVNRGAPVPPRAQRLRLWVRTGGALAFRSGIALEVLRQREGEDCRLMLHVASPQGEALLPHNRMMRIDALVVVPRAIAYREGAPVALLVEVSGPAHAVLHDVRVAA